MWDTIVLRKPGKPRYDVPKAHWPIALMNTLGKLLSTLVAEDLTCQDTDFSEKYELGLEEKSWKESPRVK